MADTNTALYAVVDMSKKEKRSSLKIPEKEITEFATTGSDEDIPPPIPDRLQADYSMITMDNMYSTGNQSSQKIMETVMDNTEKITGNSQPVYDKLVPAGIYSQYSMVTSDNVDPTASPPKPTASDSAHAHSKEEKKDPNIVESRCASSKIVACIFIAMAAAVTLIALASIVYLYVEVANLKLKTQTAPPQHGPDQQNFSMAVESLHLTLEENIQQMNSSIHTYLMMFSEEFTAARDGTRLLVANLGLSKSFPAYSCATLPSTLSSGYYWVRASDGSPVSVYCYMNRTCGGVTGGWMRVAYLDMTNSSHQCPGGLEVNSTGVRVCVRNESAGGCSSVLFATHNIVQYTNICGRIGAYRQGLTDGFNNVSDINKPYVDGVSLTHGNPRQHIWTFAAALNESSCSCNHSNPEGVSPPEVVGNDYFCDSGRRDVLWQGTNCTLTANECCSFNNPPWFHKLLPQHTTDDIEMRVCRDGNRDEEDVRIEIVEIYAISA